MAEKVHDLKIKLGAGESSALKEIRKTVLQLAAPPQLVQFSYYWRNICDMHTCIWNTKYQSILKINHSVYLNSAAICFLTPEKDSV